LNSKYFELRMQRTVQRSSPNMSRKQHIAWPEVLDLRVVKTLGEVVSRQWNLGIGFAGADGALLRLQEAERYATFRPFCQLLREHANGDKCLQTVKNLEQLRSHSGAASLEFCCHAGLQEMAAPIVIDGATIGYVIAGGYIGMGNGDRTTLRDKLTSLNLSSLDLPDVNLERSIEEVPVLSDQDVYHLGQLLELLAREIVRFQTEVAETERRLDSVYPVPKTRYSYDDIIGRSRPMQELYLLLDKVIDSDSTVLIHGENGTGKELIAKAIHFNSLRKNRRFVVQNCSAFNDNLLDSELFGHKKGAFTGAISDKQGLFEVADGSTFFLDEIGDMSPSLQVKLLRVLQEGTFIPVGDTQPKQVDVRIIAATNRDLKQMVERNEFREDLYYRINVINIRIPPLRERKEDIPLLVDHFLKLQTRGGRLRPKTLSKTCTRRLMEYNWPGNIRELENEIERLVVLAGEEKLVGDELLSSRIRQPSFSDALDGGQEPTGLPDAIQRLERTMIYEVLKRNHWNKTRAAQDLNISRRNLIRKVNKYNLDQRRTR
jgi:transcriptional regulator with PAS, ATPase and Fis domain